MMETARSTEPRPENDAIHANPVELDFGPGGPSALRYMIGAVLPTARHRNLSPPIVARWRGHRPDATDLAAFRRITGLQLPTDRLPLLYPHTFGFRLAMAVLTHPAFPVPIWRVLQVRNRLEQFEPIAPDAALDFETRVLNGRAIAKGAEFDLHTTVHVAGRIAWQSDVTFFTRGQFGAPTLPTVAPTVAPTDFGNRVAEWSMSNTDHRRFGRFTGDYNGIHLWDWYARRMGFSRALYHPARVLGQCLARLPDVATRDAGNVTLDAWLKGPVPHGATVRLHASTSKGAFALFAQDDRPCVVGHHS